MPLILKLKSKPLFLNTSFWICLYDLMTKVVSTWATPLSLMFSNRLISWTTECDKIIVTCDVGTVQYEAETKKCEEKKKEITECEIGTAQCEARTIKYEEKK